MKRILEVKKKIGTLSKESTNPFFKSQYLNLNDLLNHIEPLLWEQGLLLLQPILDSKIHSIIIDAETNDVLTESFMLLPDLKDPQKMGSVITYYRRYTLKSLLSIAEKDDDGNNAAKPENPELTDNGYEYLINQGTKDEIQKALDNRKMRVSQKTELELNLKQLDNGND